MFIFYILDKRQRHEPEELLDPLDFPIGKFAIFLFL